MSGFVHVDCFSSSLSDLTTRQKRDIIAVYDHLLAFPRFSCFDVDRYLAPTIDRLLGDDLLTTDPDDAYPWHAVKPTERGEAWRRGEVDRCPDCKSAGLRARPISKRSAIAEICPRCGGTGYAPKDGRP